MDPLLIAVRLAALLAMIAGAYIAIFLIMVALAERIEK